LTIAEDQFVEDYCHLALPALPQCTTRLRRRVDREPARELLAAKELSQFVEREIARDAGTDGRVQH
jgi:hypothetical protein